MEEDKVFGRTAINTFSLSWKKGMMNCMYMATVTAVSKESTYYGSILSYVRKLRGVFIGGLDKL